MKGGVYRMLTVKGCTEYKARPYRKAMNRPDDAQSHIGQTIPAGRKGTPIPRQPAAGHKRPI